MIEDTLFAFGRYRQLCQPYFAIQLAALPSDILFLYIGKNPMHVI